MNNMKIKIMFLLLMMFFINGCSNKGGGEMIVDEKIPTKVASEVEENCSNTIATDCDHNINSDYKREYNKTRKFKKEGIVPIWMKHPELCVSEEPTEEEKKEMDKDLADIQEKISQL